MVEYPSRQKFLQMALDADYMGEASLSAGHALMAAPALGVG
jgi:hypothetical protein